MPHIVRRFGNKVVLVPTLQEQDSIYQTTILPGLDWRHYVAMIAPQLFILSEVNWFGLWRSLAVDDERVANITPITEAEIFLL